MEKNGCWIGNKPEVNALNDRVLFWKAMFSGTSRITYGKIKNKL